MSNSLVEQICTVRNKFDELQKRHNDNQTFSDAIANALDECDLPSIGEIKERYYKETNTERLLRIGIVGRVKAGKSSLLNSLVFRGQDILPKAATPMTAALTFLEFGEKPSVTVEFFEQSDINKFSENAKKYESLRKKKENEIYEEHKKRASRRSSMPQDDETIKKNAKNNAITEMNKNKILASSYDQYQRIQKVFSSVSDKIAKGKEILSIQSITDIKKVLVNYVGESGTYMPITKSVSITLPLPELKGVTIVDTPGFNDPVPSRDNKANELLRECDVVLILSMTGQMISDDDVKVISKITTKEGIRELYIIASQFDTPLHGREILEASNHKLKDAIHYVKNDTITQTKKVVAEKLNQDGVFNTILSEGEKRIFHSSGLCQSMFDTWANKQNWDEGRNHVWKNLVRDFPDDFSNSDAETSKYSLALLGNIKAIQASIQDVKTRKKKIFHDKLMGFQTKYDTAAREAHKKILEDIDEHIKSIKKADLAKIEKKIVALEKFMADIKPAFENIFDIAIEDWEIETLDGLNQKLDEFAKITSGEIGNAKGSKTDRWTTGLIFKKEHSNTYTTVNASEVKNSIQRFIDKMNMMIKSYMSKQNRALKMDISSKILQFWLMEYSDTIDNKHKITKSIRNIVREAIVTISDYSEKPFSNQTGILTSYEAEEFIDKANAYAGKLKKSLSTWICDNVEATIYNLKNKNFATIMLKKYEDQLNQKKEEAKEPTRALENWTRIQKEVQQIL